MGPQQVLRAAACLAVTASIASAAPRTDRVAVIDLGPDTADASVRGKLASAVVDAGLEPVYGDGIEDALAGIDVERDAVSLAAALADAREKFGALDCPGAVTDAQTAISIGAGRQAAGLAVPELPRAWAYVLLCADRTSDTPLALVAASAIRTLGGSKDVDAKILAKYPDVDALSNREVIEIEIKADAPGADIWIDFKRAGISPLKLPLAAGPHVIAAAKGSQRGVLTGTVVRKQPVLTVPLADQAGKWTSIAKRVASWKGALPSPAELATLMTSVNARVAIVRKGSTIEAWGHAGLAEPLRRLGGADDGVRTLDDAAGLVALISDRIQTWSDRAPDPDQPLLTESSLAARARVIKEEEKPAAWWVYATIGGAILAGALVIYAHDSADNTQHVEIHYP
ncbi:MAG TPA: hypothetical protein VMZ53_02960 [Kofleriaceae bacterium]|nr:hypothetical protein [Kofleriaceae bacterium]